MGLSISASILYLAETWDDTEISIFVEMVVNYTN